MTDNNPHPGGDPKKVARDEPNRRGGTDHGNRGGDRHQRDLNGAGNFADGGGEGDEGLTRGAPPKPRKRDSLAG